MSTFITQGAEAKIHRIQFLGYDCICKQRLQKKYRNEILDKKINKQRIIAESRNLLKARKAGISAPLIYNVDFSENTIIMEFIDGITIKDYLKLDNVENIKIADKLGDLIAKLHNTRIIHGDLTTSNLLIKNGNIYLIDMGLSYTSNLDEDKAVDLYVLERSLVNLDFSDFFNLVLHGYSNISESSTVIKRLNEGIYKFNIF